jgi:magnesium-transporting ATPase (P-type)
MTGAFCITAFAQLCYSLACRSQRYTMPELGLFTNWPLLWAIVISGLLFGLYMFSVLLVIVAVPGSYTRPTKAS